VRISIGGVHDAYGLKRELGRLLEGGGYVVLDVRAYNPSEPDDYPDFASAVGRAVTEGRAERGVLLCGSEVGASVAANKIPGIQAGLCHDTYPAHQGMKHDHINGLVLGPRVIGQELVAAPLGASPSHEERHERRLRKNRPLEVDPPRAPEG
jgi:RpiB/LacA/LacB family sugar-phosphate isomerase